MNSKTVILKSVGITLAILVLSAGIIIFRALLDPEPVNYLAAYFRFSLALSLTAGGFYAGFKERKKSWQNGACVGLIICFLGLICSLLLFPQSLRIVDLFKVLGPGTIWAGMAGVCGGNIAKLQRDPFRPTKVNKKTQV